MARLLAILVAAASAAALPFSLPAALPPHPRLILTPSAIQDMRNFIANNTIAQDMYNRTLAQGEYYLTQPPLRPTPNGTAPNARLILQRIYALGVLYAATDNVTWARRGIAEAVNGALCVEWDVGGVQLNTGEMMHALGVALDWFSAALTNATERRLVTQAIVALGLTGVRDALGPSPPSWADAFVATDSNWNTVILGGSIVGALSVLGEPDVPSWVADLVPALVDGILISVDGWGPDGSWKEGANYGGYAARYLAPAGTSLLTATGNPLLLTRPGVALAPRFLVSAMARIEPFREYFYYDDARDIPETITAYMAMARFAGDGAAAYGVRLLATVISVDPTTPANQAMNAPVLLAYFTDIGTREEYEALPTVARFSGSHVAFVRSSFDEDETANNTFIGFKGTNVSWAWAHAHLDATAFVYAAKGQWFAQDLGADNYALPQYFSPNRFTLYRTGTVGHNTLSFDGENQRCAVTGKYSTNCSVNPLYVFNVSNESSPSLIAPAPPAGLAVDAFAIVNVTDGYAHLGVSSAQRGFIVAQTRTQLVTVDEVSLDPAAVAAGTAPKELWWSLHTVANVSLSADGLTATLTTWNVSVPVQAVVVPSLTACPGAAFAVIPVNLTAPQVPTPGISRLSLTAPASTCTRVVVALGMVPVSVDFAVAPLAAWQAEGPLVPPSL
jgi:hypothetical protein